MGNSLLQVAKWALIRIIILRDELCIPSGSSRKSLPNRSLQRIYAGSLRRGGQVHVSARPLLRVGPGPGVRQLDVLPGRLDAGAFGVGSLLSPIT